MYKIQGKICSGEDKESFEIAYKEFKGMTKRFRCAKKLNLDKKARIEKSIEYIENNLIPFGEEWHWDNGCIKDYIIELLKILKGEDND